MKRIIGLREVMRRTGLSRRSIYIGVEDRSFPTPIYSGDRVRGWRVKEIKAWLQRSLKDL